MYRTQHWLVEHCVGPLGLGALIVKPERHVTAVADLTDGEAAELGGLLRQVSQVASTLVGADQVYNCLWSHAGGKRVHIHYVVQPVTSEQMAEFGAYGPTLQISMLEQDSPPPADAVEEIAARARQLFSRG
jgi:diadenosine tetraphosphate (Ap4A) HIT family hydrolase